jgi:hypothetical protein
VRKFYSIITASLLGIMITGCSLLPSKWDDNEAAGVTDLRWAIIWLDCELDPVLITHMIDDIYKKHGWLSTYVETKGTSDIEYLLDKMSLTLDPMYEKETVSQRYCALKQGVLLQQSEAIALTVMGRYD